MNGAKYEGPMTAVLGPTNTGKTYLALQRMLGHATGMIGFPLRLLARENYDKVVQEKGVSQVALVTGEEKIIPQIPKKTLIKFNPEFRFNLTPGLDRIFGRFLGGGFGFCHF